jgi:flagellar hook-basal body complex protein FliE
MSGFWNGSGMSGVTSGAASLLNAATAGASGASGASGAGAGAPFAGMFRAMVEQTSALNQKASDAVTGLLNGQGVEIHDAMIATQKADMAFELALQVRNKAVGAYQQMMAMQF